jgi:hypothetical protein
MAIRLITKLINTDGYEHDRLRDDYTTTSYTKYFSQKHSLSGSTDKVKIDLGPVATAKVIYIHSGSVEITVYKNGSAEGWTFTGRFIITGCTVTSLHIKSESDSTPFVYIAGE